MTAIALFVYCINKIIKCILNVLVGLISLPCFDS